MADKLPSSSANLRSQRMSQNLSPTQRMSRNLENPSPTQRMSGNLENPSPTQRMSGNLENPFSSQSENPPSTQIMPGTLRRQIAKIEADIAAIGEEWARKRGEQDTIEAELENKKKFAKELQKEIRVEEKRVKEEYVAWYPKMQQLINEKEAWITSIKDLYPNDN